MDPLRQSGEQLAIFWHSVEKTLENVSTNLEQQFERTYSDKDPASASSAKYNPHKLVTRLRDADVALPDMTARVEKVANVDEWLPTNLTAQSSSVAAALASVVSANNSQDDKLSLLLERHRETEKRIAEVLERQREAWQQYTKQHDLLREAESIDTVLPDVDMQPMSEEQESPECVAQEEEEEMAVKVEKSNPKPKPKPRAPPTRQKRSVEKRGPSATVAKKAGKASGGNSSGVEDNGGFVPIEKSAFNRLPRNLKVGKLPDINAFYEKVYNVLKDRGPMEEGELLAAVEETKATKLASLRGLSVLRNGANGWYLAGSKK